MKKLFFFAICCFISIGVCHASVYYSDYSNYSDWSIEEVNSSDLYDVISKKEDKYYHELITGDYYLKNSNPTNYNLLDSSNTKPTNTSTWSFTKPQEIEGRYINKKRVYEYSYALPIRYIHINNAYGGYGSLRISEIVVKVNGANINYSISCDNCSNNFNQYVSNGIKTENFSHIFNGGNLLIDIGSNVQYDTISVELSFYDVENINKSFNISFSKEPNTTPYLESSPSLLFISTSLNNIHTFTYDYTNMPEKQIEWSSIYIADSKMVSSRTMKVKENMQYSYYDTLYYYYRVDKEYGDESNYFNLKEEGTTYYSYRKRDKIEIKDDIKITQIDDKIENYITSTIPYTIEGNVDFLKDGTYKLKIIVPFKTIDIDVTVEISEMEKDKVEIINKINDLQNIMTKNDTVNEYNNLIEEVNNDKVEINRLNILNEEYKKNLEIKEEEKNIMSKQYENELINLKLANEKVTSTEPTKVDNKWKYTWIIIIISLLLLLLVSLKKRKPTFVEDV